MLVFVMIAKVVDPTDKASLQRGAQTLYELLSWLATRLNILDIKEWLRI